MAHHPQEDAALSAPSAPIVQEIRLALTKSALILVRVHVALVLNVMLSITVRSVAAQHPWLVILSHCARSNHVNHLLILAVHHHVV